MIDKYKIKNEYITGSKLDYLTMMCDHIRNTDDAKLTSDQGNNLHTVYGYVILKNGDFGLILYDNGKCQLYVVFDEFQLLIRSKSKQISVVGLNFRVEIHNVGCLPDFVKFNEKIKENSPVLKAYVKNVEFRPTNSIPPIGYAGSTKEWINDSGCISKIKIQMEIG